MYRTVPLLRRPTQHATPPTPKTPPEGLPFGNSKYNIALDWGSCGERMEGGLRKRQTAATLTTVSSSSDGPATRQPMQNETAPALPSRWRAAFFFWSALRLLGSGLYIAGFAWRISLHTGTECEMTYSYRNFLEIQTKFQSPSKATEFYKLYKFVDGRDPRYQRLLRDPQPLVGNSHCSGTSTKHSASNTTLVLYVPGHWGSHGQARSVGAHGTQWTRSRENSQRGHRELMDGTWSGKAERIEDFIYEVYAVDFAEQGGALHGRFLELQSDFVAHVVQSLAETCSVNTIMIVAHSMGGYVARLAPIRHPHVQQYLPNIVTLATPHDNPLYAFDETMHRVHQSLSTKQDANTYVVSISGGLRDEMIDPRACEIAHGDSPSYLSSTLMRTGLLGMDHRAIVWCHGILEQVRKVIWALSKDDSINAIDKRSDIVSKILGMPSYQKDLAKLVISLTIEYGPLKAWIMESAMLYNLPMLYGLYAIGAGLYCALAPWIESVGLPLDALGAALLCMRSDLPILPLLILTVVANSIHRLIVSLLRWASPCIASHQESFRFWVVTFVIILIVILSPLVALAIVDHRLEHWTRPCLASCLVYTAGLVAMYLACLWLIGRRDCCIPFVALVMLLAPGIMAGAVTLMVWEQDVEARSWWLWARLVVPVMSVCWLKGTRQKQSNTYSRIGTTTTLLLLLRVLVVVSMSRMILLRGNAYRVGHLVFAVAVSELLLEAGYRKLRAFDFIANN